MHVGTKQIASLTSHQTDCPIHVDGAIQCPHILQQCLVTTATDTRLSTSVQEKVIVENKQTDEKMVSAD